MNIIDLTNAFFEGGGSILCWMNVLKLRRDREVKGVFWPAQVFWSVWGLWNCFYYGAVGHPFSQIAGAILVGGNITWTLHAFWYATRPAPFTLLPRVLPNPPPPPRRHRSGDAPRGLYSCRCAPFSSPASDGMCNECGGVP